MKTVLTMLAVLSLAAPAAAQGERARRRVAAGEVTGLEMRIDGTLSAPPGGRPRWFVTLYEVVRRRDLRPAPDASLEVHVSFAPGEPLVRVVTDAEGHATLEIPLPEDLDHPPHVRVIAVSPRGVRRVFSVGLELAPRHVIDLFVDRVAVRPRATVAAFGRVRAAASGRPVAGATVHVELTSCPASGAPVELVTDARGAFYAPGLVVPDAPPPPAGRRRAGPACEVAVTARSEHEGERVASASVPLRIEAPRPPARWVEASAPDVVVPGATFDVEVYVRDLDGAPVRGARVAWRDPETEAERESRLTTGADGRARLAWRAPSALAQPWERHARVIVVTDPAAGVVGREVAVRVARVPVVAGWAVEGGALVPGLDGRVLVRVVTPDGAPHAGEVGLEAPRLGGSLRATTDADGVAVFVGRVAPGESAGACGGSTALDATLVVGAHRERLCLPLDPDATLRIASAELDASAVRVAIERAPSLGPLPIELVALVRESRGWRPVARAHGDARASRITLPLSEELRGEVWLRARAIADGAPLRGGSLLIHRPHADVAALALDADEAHARLGGSAAALSTAIFATDDEALLDAARARLGEVGAARAAGRTEAFVAGLLAARTPSDTSASLVQRAGERVALPLPADPVAEGLLRDPWRTRARFVRGRLGRLMRAVESYVEMSVPSRVTDVAVREGGRWRFNREVLTPAVAQAGLAEEGTAGLDGEPLDIDALTALDPTFTYDRVAHRVTRSRLWRLHVFLRDAVRRLGLDLPWARRGDPAELVLSVFDHQHELGLEHHASQADLFDGWGQPFVLRRAPGGRARFRFLEVLEGWELASAGPDGRPGTADDVTDPFARALPAGSLYAEAVGEDVLLARLGGVALGRATLEALAEAFSLAEAGAPYDGDLARAHATWDALPSAPQGLPPPPPVLDPIEAPIGGLGPSPAWTLPSARRGYRAVAVGFGADGGLALAEARFVAGAPWVARLEAPAVMRPGERLRVPIELVRLADAPPPGLRVAVAGRGLEARVEGATLELTARAPGLATLTVTVRDGAREVSRLERRLRVVPDGLLRQRVHALRIEREGELVVEVPSGARRWRSELVVFAPGALHADPALAPLLERSPAILAWARAMADAAPDEALLARAEGAASALEAACASVAWAPHERHAQRASWGVTRTRELLDGDLSSRAAVLAALAPWSPVAPEAHGAASITSRLREDGWRAFSPTGDAPAVLARVAAALLSVDREDARGRALLARAAGALTEDAHGRRGLPGDSARVGDGWIGTLALAVAARQAGDDALADELGASATSRLHLLERTGAEGAFWALAASAYGALGAREPSEASEASEVAVELDGRAQAVAMDGGAARVPVGSSARVRVRATQPVWARLETRYLAPVVARDGGPLRARIEGTPGRAGQTAGLELVVESASERELGRPTLDLVLPSAAALDDAALRALERVEGVAAVRAPDGAGVLRIELAPLAPGAERRVPLAWRWLAAGVTRGLDLVAYDASAPHDAFVREGRTLTLEEAP
ncbi:MAG: hypothetical protein KF729_14735 [Sandaracinaceae bacterium]|nr:hypothetical protein [Sandaracinaceae bacterium]